MRRIFLGALVSAAVWTASCSSSDLTTSPSVTTTSEGGETGAESGRSASLQGSALVRLVNADPGQKGVDILRDNEKLFSDVSYKSITAYSEAPRGRQPISLRSADGTMNLSASHRELVPGRHYTLVALPKEMGSRLAVFSDNLGALEPGETRVRVINATTDVDDLDLFIAGTKNHLLHGIDAGAATSTSFADMEPGSVEIRSPSQAAPTLVGKFDVEGDRFYTFIVTGTASNLDVVQIVDSVDSTEP